MLIQEFMNQNISPKCYFRMNTGFSLAIVFNITFNIILYQVYNGYIYFMAIMHFTVNIKIVMDGFQMNHNEIIHNCDHRMT